MYCESYFKCLTRFENNLYGLDFINFLMDSIFDTRLDISLLEFNILTQGFKFYNPNIYSEISIHI